MDDPADRIARLEADLAARDAEIARLIGARERRVAELIAANNTYLDHARAARREAAALAAEVEILRRLVAADADPERPIGPMDVGH